MKLCWYKKNRVKQFLYLLSEKKSHILKIESREQMMILELDKKLTGVMVSVVV